MGIGKIDFDSRIQPIAKKRIHDQISAQINQMIAEGFLKPGDQLPSERELAERFKVSRNSVRDALRTLEAKGLLEIRQGGGTYVREARLSELYQSMLEALVDQKERTRAILQVRYIIEPGVAFFAAKNATTELLQKLEELIARHEAKAIAGDPGVEEDSQFHNTIAQMTGNQYLIWLLRLINEHFEGTRDAVLKYQGSSSRKGHRNVLQALKNRDPEEARKAMEAHLKDVMEAYELLESEENASA